MIFSCGKKHLRPILNLGNNYKFMVDKLISSSANIMNTHSTDHNVALPVLYFKRLGIGTHSIRHEIPESHCTGDLRAPQPSVFTRTVSSLCPILVRVMQTVAESRAMSVAHRNQPPISSPIF